MAIAHGSATAFFLFDVAERIDLAAVRARFGDATATRLTPRPVTPPYVQYADPPIALDAAAVDEADIEGFRLRFKLFDYGVISVAASRPLPPTWKELLSEGVTWYESEALSLAAEQACRALVARLGSAVTAPRREFLSEDYWVFVVTGIEGAPDASALLAGHGADLAQLLRGEREPLSAQERDEVLRHRISYFANDLVIPTWNGAFVYDTEAGASATLEVLEYANSQLLEFRYYDNLLAAELQKIYAQLERGGWKQSWFGRRYAKAAREVQALYIDVSDLTDRAERALTLTGDVYAARVFGLAATRLGLAQWKGNISEKLKTLDDIYRFAVEHTAMTRGEVLEIAIVLLFLLDLILLFND